MGVARSGHGEMCPQFDKEVVLRLIEHGDVIETQTRRFVVLRLIEHGDVIETQTRRFVPPKFLVNSVPAYNHKKSCNLDVLSCCHTCAVD